MAVGLYVLEGIDGITSTARAMEPKTLVCWRLCACISCATQFVQLASTVRTAQTDVHIVCTEVWLRMERNVTAMEPACCLDVKTGGLITTAIQVYITHCYTSTQNICTRLVQIASNDVNKYTLLPARATEKSTTAGWLHVVVIDVYNYFDTKFSGIATPAIQYRNRT